MPRRILVAAAAAMGAVLLVLPCQPVQAAGSKGQPVTPATIAFRDASTDEIKSDNETAYIDQCGGADGCTALEVFFGSQANKGNIFLRPNDSSRLISLTLPNLAGTPCNGLPSGTTNYDFMFLKVDVDSVVTDGVFGLANGESVLVPMRIRFFSPGVTQDGSTAYVLNFNPANKVCKGGSGSVKVTRTSNASWTVTDDGSACLEKANPKGQSSYCWSGQVNFSFDAVPK